MKKLIPTILVLCLLAGIYLYAQSKDFFRGAETDHVPLTHFEEADVSAVDIKHGEIEINLIRQDEQWFNADDRSLRLDSSRVDSWIGKFNQIEHEGLIEESPANYADFGLDSGQYEFSVSLLDGSKQTVYMGNELPIEGHHYVKTPEADSIYQVDSEWMGNLNKDLLYFLDKNVLFLDLMKIHSIELTVLEDHWRLERQGDAHVNFNAPWKLEGQDKTYSDISGILGRVINLQTEQLPVSIQGLKFDQIHILLNIKQYRGDELHMHEMVGEVKDDDVLLWEMGTSWAYMVKLDTIGALFQLGLELIEEK